MSAATKTQLKMKHISGDPEQSEVKKILIAITFCLPVNWLLCAYGVCSCEVCPDVCANHHIKWSEFDWWSEKITFSENTGFNWKL